MGISTVQNNPQVSHFENIAHPGEIFSPPFLKAVLLPEQRSGPFRSFVGYPYLRTGVVAKAHLGLGMHRGAHTRQGMGWRISIAANPGQQRRGVHPTALIAGGQQTPAALTLEVPLLPHARAGTASFLPGSSSAS